MSRNRAAVKRRLVDIGNHALAAFEVRPPGTIDKDDPGRTDEFVVRYTWDGGVVNESTLFLGVVEGPAERVAIGDKPKSDDRFSINGYIAVPGFTTDEQGARDAEDAAERALAAFEAAIPSRLVDEEIESEDGPEAYVVQWAYIANVDGPYHGKPDAQSASYSGGVTFTVECLKTLR